MDAESYRNLQPQYNELMSRFVDYAINMHDILKTYGAAQDEALGREANKDEHVEFVKKVQQDNKVAKSYNLMRALTGCGSMMNADVSSGTEGLRYYSGSTSKNKIDKAASEKVQKSYELMRLFMR